MNRTQRRARLAGDRERQRTLLINAAQHYDARRDIERENRQEREHHDAAKRVVSKIDGVTTSLEFLDIGGDCRRRKAKLENRAYVVPAKPHTMRKTRRPPMAAPAATCKLKRLRGPKSPVTAAIPTAATSSQWNRRTPRSQTAINSSLPTAWTDCSSYAALMASKTIGG